MKYIQEIGIRAHDLPAHTPEELRQNAEKLDIKYVQLALRKSFNDMDWKDCTFSHGFASRIRRGLGDLRISVLGSYINVVAEGEEWENARKTISQNMLFAKYLNAGVVGTETCCGICNHTEKEYQIVLKHIRDIADEAEKLGVMVAVEGVSVHAINTPQLMKRLLDEVNSPNVLMIFDPVNYITAENYKNQDEIIKAAFELTAGKMTAIHLKDFVIEDGKKKETRVGEGIFNIKLLAKCIKEYKPNVDILLEGSDEEWFGKERARMVSAIEE